MTKSIERREAQDGTWETVVVDENGGNGGSQPQGQSIFGDGHDGTVELDGTDYPDPTPVTAWNDATPYVVGDLVKSTGTNVRVWRCVRAGTSGAVDPFPDGDPGHQSRALTLAVDAGVIWAQATLVIGGFLEGNVYATDLTISGAIINHGWILYATGSCEITNTGTLDGDGADAVGGTGGTTVDFWVDGYPFLGRGAPNPGGNSGQGDAPAGLPWLIGGGGYGGAGADNNAGIGLNPAYNTDNYPVHALTSFMFNLTQLRGANGGGSGASDGASDGGGGGEGGWAHAILAHEILIAGTVNTRGGDGAAGNAGGDTGGGGGGQGGPVFLIGDTIDTTGATLNLDGGQGGAGQGTGTNGGDGSPGQVIEIPNAS